MEYREEIKKKYIEKVGLPNARIIDYKDKKHFDFYSYDQIPKGIALADSAFLDENKELKYGFVKNFNGEEMRLIIGYTGSGKSMRYLLQQLMVCIKTGQSAIVTDLSGQLLEYAYDLLVKQNVNVKLLNFIDPKNSDTYNPFYKESVRCKKAGKILTSTEENITSIASKMVPAEKKDDPSWTMGAKSIVKGIIYGMHEELIKGNIEPKDINFCNIVHQFFWLQKNSVDKSGSSIMDRIEYYKNKDSNDKSIQLLSSYVNNSEKTRANYYGIVVDGFSEINSDFLFNLTSTNTIELKELWEKQTVLFINTGDKSIGDFLTGIIVDQLYQEATEVSAKTIDKKLPIPIQLFLDEFANIPFGNKKKFGKMITTTRKMQIFFNMFIQNYTQLKLKLGEDTASTITSNSTEIFLGTKDYESRNHFASTCGKKTIETLDSIYHNSEPRLTSVPLLTAEDLLKIPQGYMYVTRNGYDLIKVYFEGAYNCDMFKPSQNYKKKFSNKKYDYKNHILLQPQMVSRKKEIDKEEVEILDMLTTEEIKELLNFYDSLVCDDKKLLNKFIKYGLIEKDDGKLSPTISKDVIEKTLEESKLFWEF